MIINVPSGAQDLVFGLLLHRTTLTPEQLAQLQGEITNDPLERGYAGKSPKEVLVLLHSAYTTLVPATKTLKSVVTGQEIKDWLPTVRMRLIASSLPEEIKTEWREVCAIWAGVSDAYTFDPNTSTSWQSLKTQGLACHLVDQDMIDRLESITQSEQHQTFPSRLAALSNFGAGIVLEEIDLLGIQIPESPQEA